MACDEKGRLTKLASKLGCYLNQAPPVKKQIVAKYDYTDEKGVLLYQVVRYSPKDFRQCRPDGKGGLLWNLEGVKRVLYKLPELIASAAAETVFIPEGEKDVDNLRSIGLVATCNSEGAGKFTIDLREPLKDRNAIVIADKDEPGRRHAQQVAAVLYGFAASIKIMEMPGDKVKDVSDWIDSGGKAQALKTLVANTPVAIIRPTIVTSKRFLREIVTDAWNAVQAANNPPVVFQFGRQFADIVLDHNRHPAIRILEKPAIKGMIDRLADFVTETGKGEMSPARPPGDVIDDMIATKEIPLPNLVGIIDVPIFDAGGNLCASTGYQTGTECFLQAAKALTIADVSAKPSEADISKAKGLLLDELLGEFPFVDDADKCHALAVLLLPFVRSMIDGPTPLHMIESPTPGSGKGLLTRALTIPAAGLGPAVMTEAGNDEEMRKRITSKLMQAPRFILIDNINGRLDSASLSSALTTRDGWEDRLMGHSRDVILPVTCVWIATANNPSFSLEMARRTVSIRIDPRVEHPELRSGFKHTKLGIWARNNRGNLVWAALTLVQRWIALGKPAGQETLGSYEEYAEIMGGIFMAVGIPCFLANRDRVYTAVDQEVVEVAEFCQAWWNEFQSRMVGVDLLFNLAVRQRLLNQILGGREEQAARTRLGIRLTSMRDRVVGEFRVHVCPPNTHTKTQNYQLESMKQLVIPSVAGAAGGAVALTPPRKVTVDKNNEIKENESKVAEQPDIFEDAEAPRSPRTPCNGWEMEI